MTHQIGFSNEMAVLVQIVEGVYGVAGKREQQSGALCSDIFRFHGKSLTSPKHCRCAVFPRCNGQKCGPSAAFVHENLTCISQIEFSPFLQLSMSMYSDFGGRGKKKTLRAGEKRSELSALAPDGRTDGEEGGEGGGE